MNKKSIFQKFKSIQGSSHLLAVIIVIIVAIIIGGGVYVWQKTSYSPKEAPQNSQIKSIQSARKALIAYFKLLNEGQYNKAIEYHGSGYDYLRSWNPNLNENDYAGLLKNGCEMNGLQCLKIKNIVKQQQISPTEFRFVVQFANNDGSLFKRNPCCGGTEKQMPSKTDFEFIVKLINGKYVIVTQPVYTP